MNPFSNFWCTANDNNNCILDKYSSRFERVVSRKLIDYQLEDRKSQITRKDLSG